MHDANKIYSPGYQTQYKSACHHLQAILQGPREVRSLMLDQESKTLLHRFLVPNLQIKNNIFNPK
jgi:hypothetical protein